MSDPICNNCDQPCDVIEVDNSALNASGAWERHSSHGVSRCCRTGYKVLSIAEQIQREELALRSAQRGVRL
jgi:hypothetical protein